MVQKIITAFRAKHKFNLSNERLQVQADKWAKNIENEEDIESFIENVDVDHLIEIAKLDDALRAKPKNEEPKDTDVQDDPLKAIMDEIKTLKTELADSKSQSIVKSRSEQLKDLPNELKATLKFVKLDELSNEDFESLKTDLNTQAESIQIAQSITNPYFSGKKPEGTLSADKAKEIANKI